MKNFKQLIPAIILSVFVVGTVAFADWTQPSSSAPCNGTPAGCNALEPINITTFDQVKTGGFTSNYIGSFGDILSKKALGVGSSVGYANASAGLRVLDGYSWFNDKVFIGNDSGITSGSSPSFTPDYTLTLKPGSTTNIGMGSYCTMYKSEVTGGVARSCPAGHYISKIDASAPSNGAYITCTAMNPWPSPINKGMCYSAPTPNPSAPTITRIGSTDVCDTEDNYLLTTTVTDGVPQINTQWQSRDATANTSWTSTPSPYVTVPKHGTSSGMSWPVKHTIQFRVIATDALNHSATSSVNSIDSVERPTHDANGNRCGI